MNTPLTLTIGIPAYNEEKNIINSIQSLLNQREDGFTLQEIIVADDGSTDATLEKVSQITDKRVRVLHDGKRKGKPARTNQLFKEADTDVFIQIDADVVPADNHTIYEIIKAFKNEDIMLVAPHTRTVAPHTFVQKVIATGDSMWRETKERSNNDMYNCIGQCRAFRKKLYKEIEIPDVRSDDIFPYLYCKEKKYSFKKSQGMIVYTPPATYRDFVSQMSRYLTSKKEHTHVFNEDIVQNNFTITTQEKLKVFAKYLLTSPIKTLCYLLFLVPPRIIALFDDGTPKGIWDSVDSTKEEIEI